MAWREQRLAAKSRQYYKRGIDAEHLKRKREDLSWRLRKEKREEKNSQRRALLSPSAGDFVHPDQWPQYVSNLRSVDLATQTEALRQLVHLVQGAPETSAVLVEQGVPRDLINLLVHSDRDSLHEPCASLLLLLADRHSDQTQLIVDCGAVPALRDMIGRTDCPPSTQRAVLTLLVAIAESSPALRDYLLHVQIVPRLLPVLRQRVGDLLLNVIWCLDALGKGSPPPSWDDVVPMVDPLLALLRTPGAVSQEVQQAACWVLAHLSDANSVFIHHLMQGGLVTQVLIPRLSLPTLKDHRPALRLIGNVAAGEDAHTAIMIQQNLLPHLRDLIHHGHDMQVVREAAWTLSNISSGPHTHIQALLDTPSLLESLLEKARDAPEFVQIEIAWVCTNMASVGTVAQIQQLVTRGGLQLMADLLQESHHNLILIVVEGIGCVWSAGQHFQERLALPVHPYRALLEETGALDQIQLLAHSKNPQVSQAVYHLLDELSDGDEGSEEEYLVPASYHHNSPRDEYLF